MESKVTSLAIALTVVQMQLAALQVSEAQETKPATAAEPQDISHVTALSMVAWMALSATSADARVTSLATARTLLQPEDFREDQVAFRVVLRPVDMVELEDSVTVRCSATAAEDMAT